MMSDKMISFLKHINIENIDDFDIDFEMVGRNRFNRNQIDMMIVKSTPWKYHLLICCLSLQQDPLGYPFLFHLVLQSVIYLILFIKDVLELP